MPKVNPDILRWARETAGFSLEEAVSKIGIKSAYGLLPEERLELLETGENEPSRTQLVKMAKQYHRPLLTFYMSEPPRRGDRGEDFRTLPDVISNSQNALVDVMVRQTRARQSMLRATLIEEDEAQRLSFIGSVTRKAAVESIAKRIAEVFEFDLETYRKHRTIELAFRYLRGQIEAKGVFVLLTGNLGSHHTNIDTELFRGFALADDIAPFVVINNLDSKHAWVFTLLHEIVHLMLGETGISGARSESHTEKYCNDVASEFLFPSAEAIRLFSSANLNNIGTQSALEIISDYARARNLSSSMVAYKLYRNTLITEENWRALSAAFRSFWLAARDRKRAARQESNSSGPSYYIVKRHSLGASLVNLVDRMMGAGALSTTRASKILDIAPKNVRNLFSSHLTAPTNGLRQ